MEMRPVGGSSEMGPVPAEYAIVGIHGGTLTQSRLDGTGKRLTEILGFRSLGRDGNRARYTIGTGASQAVVDVIESPELSDGVVAVGTVHHGAWRAPSDEAQRIWRQKIVEYHVPVTSIVDRTYFHSIYFREPGNVLFEIATDPPGFAVDEDALHLGSRLMLPPWLESDRSAIEKTLPVISLPKYGRAA